MKWQRLANSWFGAPFALLTLFVLAALGGVASAVGAPVGTQGSVAMIGSVGDKPLFNLTQLRPGDTNTACVDVTVDNAMGADTVAFDAEDVTGPLASYLNVTVTAGPATDASCTDFTANQIYAGTLAGLGSGTSTAAVATLDPDGLTTGWYPSQSDTWRFRFTVVTAATAPLQISATATFAWHYVQAPLTAVVPAAPAPTPKPSHVAPSGPSHSSSGHAAPHKSVNPQVVLNQPQAPWVVRGARALGAAAAALLRRPQYPAGLIALAALFVIAQEVADRRDPKLSLAPVRNDDLRFTNSASEIPL